MISFVAAEIFFVLAIILYVATVLQKTRKSLLFVLVFCDFCFALYYLFLGRFTPTCLNAIEGCLIIVLYFLEKHNKSHKIVILAVCITCVIDVVAAVLTWAGPLQLLSLASCLLYLLGVCIKRLLFTKTCTILSITCATTYWFLVAGVVNGLVGVCLFVGAVVGFVQTLLSDIKKKQLRKDHAKTVEQKTVKKLPNSQIQTEKTA